MPRDPSGNYTLPALGNPAITNTPITIAWWNGTSTDFASAFTDSLSRSGQGGMLVPFKLVDGTVSAPAFSFVSEPNTGFYRANPGDMRVSVGGADAFKWTSTAVTCLESLVVTGTSPTGRGGTFTATGAEQGLVSTGGNGAGNAGTWGIAGSATGFGAIGQGVSSGVGVYAYSSATTVDVLRTDGYVDLSHATNPALNAGFTNRLTPKNLIKAWAYAHTDGAGNVTVFDGFNIASASVATSTLTINFVTALANTNYCVVASAYSSGVAQMRCAGATARATGNVSIKCWDVSGLGIINLATVATDIHIIITGTQ